MSEIDQAELEKMRQFERIMWLTDIEKGKPVTDKQYEAIRFFLGDLIDKAKALPMRELSVHFDKTGAPHTLDTDVIKSITVDGHEYDLEAKFENQPPGTEDRE